MSSFWYTLPKPFFVLAPLANVTDAAFRQIIAAYSKPKGPQVFYTEFVSADGLMLASREGREKLMRDLVFTEAERPIVAQFFTSKPEIMERVAFLAGELGFDGVDINMGCPDRTIEKQGAGAALIKNPECAGELIRAAKRGAKGLPVSVKTRLGYSKDTLEEWLPMLLQEEPAAVAIHARTRKEMSKVPARWERVARAVEIRDNMKSQTLIIGNGDLRDLADARAKVEETSADGAMLGRAIFGRPWLFDESKNSLLAERLRIACEHTELFEKLLGDIKNFAIMKKHFKAYAEGFPGAKELRLELMEAKNSAEIEALIEDFLAGQGNARVPQV
ncbi:MAG: tRNA-dihydrouridine synthase [Patescibacteria group bacterium]|nr:tRNA-dihydrouridine synthase [Patescibacteria group bacterium]